MGAAPGFLVGPTEAASSRDQLGTGRAGAWVAEQEAGVAACAVQVGHAEWSATDLATGMWEEPGIQRWIFKLTTKAAVGSRDERSGVGEAAFGTGPGGIGGDGGTGGMEGLERPGLDAREVEEREAGGGAGPDVVGETDAGQADEAGGVGPPATGGGGDEGDEVGEGGGGGGFAGGVEVGGEDGGLEGGRAAALLRGNDGGVAVAGGGGIVVIVVGVRGGDEIEIGGIGCSGGGSGDRSHRVLIHSLLRIEPRLKRYDYESLSSGLWNCSLDLIIQNRKLTYTIFHKKILTFLWSSASIKSSNKKLSKINNENSLLFNILMLYIYIYVM